MSVDSIVNFVTGKIGDLLVQEAKLLYGVDGQVRSLQRELMMMNSFLEDKEDMDEELGERLTRTMINEIRKIAYDAEDVIESYILKEGKSSSNKKEAFFKRHACFCSNILQSHQVGSEIEDIKVRIAETTENWKKYRGESRGKRNVGDAVKRNRPRGPIAYPHNIEEHVVGLEEDVNKLIEVLTNADEARNFKVVSIVGMGGSGKTTLGRKLFNHESLKTHFDYMAWVSISQQWDTKRILLEILEKASGETMTKEHKAMSLGAIEEKLHMYFERKRYLIVLDDVWAKKALEQILPALQPSTNDGRKIIVTTRNREVNDFPDLKCFFHEPRRLSEEESWELFRKITLIHNVGSNSSSDSAVFEALANKMLKKCGGLPLAVIALAGILGKKKTLEEWEKVNKAVSSRIVEEGSGTHLYGPVKEMLTLSYNDLPRELKPCFLYLAIFPEDHEIPIGRLCKMWIAEGFITSDQLHGDTVEDVARQYLDELILRCVVQIGRRNDEGNVKTIRIHDLVRDLCIKKAEEQDFLKILSSNSPNSNSDARMTESRRIAAYFDDKPFPTKSQRLRSLYLAVVGDRNNQKLSLQPLHENFRLLRVLFLAGIKTPDGVLPTGIGMLIHLRYLGLGHTDIRQLPSSIGNLRNLLTLDCGYVRGNDEVKIPDVVWKMEGLRHLYLPFKYLSREMQVTLRLHTLKYLQTLKGIVGGDWMLEELPFLSPTVKKLSIRDGIRSNKQLEAAFRCPSIRSDSLHSLTLGWDSGTTEGEVIVLGVESLEQIIHCQHLRKLKLVGRIEERLGFDGIQFPASIKYLFLKDTELEAEATLANLGKLPSLIRLHLWNAYKGTKWTCIVRDHFPQLKWLTLIELQNWEEWSIGRGAMPLLTKLQVLGCSKLRTVPEGLKYITTLQEIWFTRNGGEFMRRVVKGGEDAHLFQDVPLVQIE